MAPSVADRLRDIAQDLRIRIDLGEYEGCPPHALRDLARLPDSLNAIADEAEGEADPWPN